ncbi:hypothetical protein BJ878DRAFT_523982 [Calycina marina]|uniref:Inosine/uridine-preferring nucleoside hydrolase domain-containing protein n=1 Tax=Calycina marina TaxID=1763456 RepID=A0A9P7YVZ0_9HELO|nr:hypothetical protein BJ878DRAFT_523982 [Calycina marina]
MSSKRYQQFDSDMELDTSETISSISSWTASSPRKVRTDHVVGRPQQIAPRRQSSLSVFGSRVQAKLHTWLGTGKEQSAMSSAGDVEPGGGPTPEAIEPGSSFESSCLIPDGLSQEQIAVYETILKVVKRRGRSEGPRVVVITDLAKDYDDLAALIILKELHRLGVITLVGFVANLMPSERRALFGRGALDSVNLRDIPIAKGTTGYPKKAYQGKVGKNQHKELPHEFKGIEEFPAIEPYDRDMLLKDGEGDKLLLKLFSDAETTGRKLTLLLISSLEDIFTFSKENPTTLCAGLENVVLQGGYSFNEGRQLVPANDANNNRYDMEAAERFHTFMQEKKIHSVVYTKIAAFATPIYSDFFAELKETGHPLGKHLHMAQTEQDLAFYNSACNKDPAKRFSDYMDQEWYLRNKTSWFENLEEDSPQYLPPDHPLYHAQGAPFPEGAKVLPYLTKVVVYDALAALGVSGEDALKDLKVLTKDTTQSLSIHRVVGTPGPPLDTGINSKEMATALCAFLKGSLLESLQANCEGGTSHVMSGDPAS